MRRSGWLWPVALALTTLLSACAKVPVRQVNTADPPGNGGVITIRILARQDTALDAAISAYYESHPNVRIDKVPPSKSGMHMMDAIKLRVNAGEVDLVPIDNPGALVKEGLILPLDSLVQRAQLDLKPYGPGLEQLRVDGKLYELPFALSPLMLTYNADLFAAAGVPGPAPGWTWDQFRETAQRLSGGTGYQQQWGFASAPGDYSILLLWLANKGANAGVTSVDDRIIGEALEYFSTLTFTDQSMPVADPEGRNYFVDGRAGMGLTSIASVEGLGLRNLAPTPTFPGATPRAVVYPRSYGIAATSPNREAAIAFLQFLAGPAGAITTARAGGIPAYRTAEAKQAFVERKPAPPAAVVALFDQAWLTLPRGDLDSPAQKRLGALGDAVQATLSGVMEWDAALAAYKRSIAQIQQ